MKQNTDRSVRLFFPPRLNGTVCFFFWKDLFNYVAVFGIATIREQKQGVIKNSYLIAAALVLWLLKETQAQLSPHIPHRGVVVKRKGKMVVKNFWLTSGKTVCSSVSRELFLEKLLKKCQNSSFLSSLQTMLMSVARFTQFHLKQTDKHTQKSPLKPQIACLVIVGYTMSQDSLKEVTYYLMSELN